MRGILKKLVRALAVFTCGRCGAEATPLIDGMCADCFNATRND